MLIKCQDCGNEISDRAANCPRCNGPLPKPATDYNADAFICESCASAGTPILFVKGRGWTELLLWLLGIVPGIIYSAWRSATVYEGCPVCRGKMIPVASPRGESLVRQYHGQRIKHFAPMKMENDHAWTVSKGVAIALIAL